MPVSSLSPEAETVSVRSHVQHGVGQGEQSQLERTHAQRGRHRRMRALPHDCARTLAPQGVLPYVRLRVAGDWASGGAGRGARARYAVRARGAARLPGVSPPAEA